MPVIITISDTEFSGVISTSLGDFAMTDDQVIELIRNSAARINAAEAAYAEEQAQQAGGTHAQVTREHGDVDMSTVHGHAPKNGAAHPGYAGEDLGTQNDDAGPDDFGGQDYDDDDDDDDDDDADVPAVTTNVTPLLQPPARSALPPAASFRRSTGSGFPPRGS